MERLDRDRRQLGNGAGSVPGSARSGNARGSLAELETRLLLAVSLGPAPEREVESALALASETGRMLTALSKALRPVTPRSRTL